MYLRKALTFILTGMLFLGGILLPAAAQTYDARIDTGITYQTLDGFGAAVAWYHGWLTNHPNKSELYNLLFKEAGLDILRLRNNYRNTPDFEAESVELVQQANQSLGYPITILLCSWSPPADLKSNNSTEGEGGTLAKVNGQFVYSGFADYWYNSILAYRAIGIDPDYISIQNEPDWTASWESCLFEPTETSTRPGYGIALDAVYKRLQGLASRPKILGPEATGIASSKVQSYMQNMNLSQIDGIAHHLYNGGDPSNPDSFNSVFQTLHNTYSNYTIWQTEYDQGNAFNTAQLIHNSLVTEGVNAYIYWELIWDAAGGKALIGLENPWGSSSWSTPKGYSVTDYYYMVKHYSKYTDPGDIRVNASINNSQVKVSAFLSPVKNRLTVVLINESYNSLNVNLTPGSFTAGSSEIYTTSDSAKFQSAGALGAGGSLSLPSRSVTTVVLSGSGSTVVKGDVNSDGIINIVDALMVAQYSVGLNPPIDVAAADVNCDGNINIIDALMIAQYSVGLVVNLNCN